MDTKTIRSNILRVLTSQKKRADEQAQRIEEIGVPHDLKVRKRLEYMQRDLAAMRSEIDRTKAQLAALDVGEGRARLDADRTARPKTRIVGHPSVGQRWRGIATDARPEYEDEKGERTALHAEDLPHRIVQRMMHRVATPHELSEEFGIAKPQAITIYSMAGEFLGGPGARGAPAYEAKIRAILARADEDRRRVYSRRNPSPRRGGVQSHEDYAEFGNIYTTKHYRDVAADADQISWSDLDPVGKDHLIEPDNILVPEYMEGGDYSGSSVTKANYDSFMEEFGEVPGVIALYGSHGSYGVGIRIEAINEEMVSVLEKLQDYPVIDEEKMSEVESEWEGEAWESWARSDFLRALRTKFPQLEDHIDALDEDRDEEHDAVLDIFEAAREAANVYWESENAGMHIRIDRVVAKVDEDDIPEPD